MEEQRWSISVILAPLQLLTLMNTTKSKQAAYQAAYYAANREKWAAYNAANREKKLAYSAAYRAANRNEIKARNAAYRAANSEREKARKAAYCAANSDKVKAYAAAYYAENSKKVQASRVNRYRTNPNFRIAVAIRWHLQRVVKSGGIKDATSLSYVGCTVAQLRRHLERQFAPGMTWQNHGEWHIDHITPLAAFDFAAFPAQIKQAEHYTNLRPMWARDNLSKSDTLLRPVQLDLIAV